MTGARSGLRNATREVGHIRRGTDDSAPPTWYTVGMNEDGKRESDRPTADGREGEQDSLESLIREAEEAAAYFGARWGKRGNSPSAASHPADGAQPPTVAYGTENCKTRREEPTPLPPGLEDGELPQRLERTPPDLSCLGLGCMGVYRARKGFGARESTSIEVVPGGVEQ